MKLGKTTTSYRVTEDMRVIKIDHTPAIKAGKKVIKRSTGKHAGQFESSNRDTAGKRIARALWG